MRTAEQIEQNIAKMAADAKQKASESAERKAKKPRHPNSLANLRMWKPGESGNPGGRKKVDLAGVIARAIFENNQEMIYKAYGQLMGKGSAYAFQVLSDRAYGKLKETVEVTSSEDVVNRIRQGRERVAKKRA